MKLERLMELAGVPFSANARRLSESLISEASIELDWAGDTDTDAEMKAEVMKAAKDAGLKAKILTMNGPGGPIVKMTGDKKDIIAYLHIYTGNDKSQVPYLTSLIEESRLSESKKTITVTAPFGDASDKGFNQSQELADLKKAGLKVGAILKAGKGPGTSGNRNYSEIEVTGTEKAIRSFYAKALGMDTDSMEIDGIIETAQLSESYISEATKSWTAKELSEAILKAVEAHEDEYSASSHVYVKKDKVTFEVPEGSPIANIFKPALKGFITSKTEHDNKGRNMEHTYTFFFTRELTKEELNAVKDSVE